LGIRLVHQGIKDKGMELTAIAKRNKLAEEEIAFLGTTGRTCRCSGRSAGHCRGRQHSGIETDAHFITDAPGGRGAVREAAEVILKAQGKWAQITKKYLKVS